MSRANFAPLLLACLIVSPLLAQFPTPQIRLITNAATLADPGYYCCEPPISPGTIIAIFGTSLSDGTTKAASGYPLPTQLAGARVMFNGIAAPLLYASPGQINAEVPTELVAPSLVNIGVDVQSSAGLASGPRVGRSLGTLSPGIFTLDQSGTGPGAILRAADYSLICPPRWNDCTGNPAIRGEAIAIYLTGLGPVSGPWISGNAAGGAYPTEQTASVRFDDVSAVVLYSGLAPNFAGLYQVNVLVPGNAPLGDAVSLTLSMGDPAITSGASNRVTVPISDKVTPPSSVVGGPPGGNVLAIATDPHSSGVLFVGTNGRSLFKSSDGGQSWVAAKGLDTYIPSVAVAPSNPSIVYVGTGLGVFRSADGGTTWSDVSIKYGGSNSVLAVDRSDPLVVYAVTPSVGLLKTKDGGVTWSVIYPRPEIRPFYPSIGAFAIDPRDSMVLYVAVYPGGIFRSNDAGLSWSAVNSGLPDSVQVNTLAIQSGSTGLIQAGTNFGVYYTYNYGVTWTATNVGMNAIQVNALAVDPSASGCIYAGTTSGVFKTNDTGQSWSAKNTGLASSPVVAVVVDPNNPAIVYAGTSAAGVFKSADYGETWHATLAK